MSGLLGIAGLILAVLLSAIDRSVSVGVCVNSGFREIQDCRLDSSARTPAEIQATCTNAYCRYCPGHIARGRQCQTDERDCLVQNPTVLTDVAEGKAACDSEGGVFCQAFAGGVQRCIMDEPTRSRCYRKRLDKNTFCSAFDGDEEGCNTAGGCFYCGPDVRSDHRSQCFPLPNVNPSCADTEDSCCASRKCADIADDPDGSNCIAMGCKVCTDPTTLKHQCVFATGPPDVGSECGPFTTALENCFEGASSLPTMDECTEMHCTWCQQRDYFFYCVREYPDSCTLSTQTACKKEDLTTFESCKLWGCEWCGTDDPDAIDCQESTYCSSCDCADRVDCWAETEEACAKKRCKWCPDATDFNCMNVNAEGVFEIGVWTPCTKTCGCGTKWRFDRDCKDTENPLNCERQYKQCNTEACPLDICPEGEIPRFDNMGTCCCNHTRACGTSNLNEKRDPDEGEPSRKKRVTGGSDIGTIKKYPWLTVVYVNNTKCAGALVSEQHVITAACCLENADASDVILNFDTYDRSLAPGIEVDAAYFDTYKELAVIETVAPFEDFGDCVQPICLPNGEPMMEAASCYVAGWGLTDADDEDSCAVTANDALVKLLPWALCEAAWSGEIYNFVPTEYFCAGFPDGDVDACSGDKGAPLMCQRCTNCGIFLAGVATEYVGCGVEGKPTVYAKVEHYESWLASIFESPDTEEYTCPET